MNAQERLQRRKKRAIIGSGVISVAIVLMLIFLSLSSSVGALTAVYPHTLIAGDMEKFDDDTNGTAPTSTFYTYTGGFLVTNKSISVEGYPIRTYHSSPNCLNISGIGGTTGQFTFNHDRYFSMDFWMMIRSGEQSIFFDFDNKTTGNTLFSIVVQYRFNASRYIDAVDMNSDGKNNEDDFAEFINHYGEHGPPGWIKEDFNLDGVINYLDLSYFVSHYTNTDFYDVFYFYNGSYTLLFTFYNNVGTWGSPTTYDWHHVYLQFSYGNSFGIVQSAYKLSSTWVSSDGPQIWGGGTWDRLNITMETTGTSHCYLDDLRVDRTAMNITAMSLTPSMNSTYTPIGSGCSPYAQYGFTPVMQDLPLFATADVYMRAYDVSDQYDIKIYPSDNWDTSWSNTVYNVANNASSGDVSTSLLTGQRKTSALGNPWEIYRPCFIFDTSSLPDNAVIDYSYVFFPFVEYPYVTNGGLNNFTKRFYLYSDDSNIYPLVTAKPQSYNKTLYETVLGTDSFGSDDLNSTIPIDNLMFSHIKTNTSTRFFLREERDVIMRSDHLGDHDVISLKSNSMNEKPYLFIRYHALTAVWTPVTSLPNILLYNHTFTTPSDLHVNYGDENLWYVNITSYGIPTSTSPSYSWEFPQTGYSCINKYCSRFTVSDYQEPYINYSSPANGSTGVDLHSDFKVPVTVRYISPMGSEGFIEFFYLHPTSYLWISDGSEYAVNNTLISHNLTIPYADPYNKVVYWRVEAEANCLYSTTQYYPNSTQPGLYVYGRRAWKLTTDVNNPPWVVSYSPANNSHFNPWLDTIYINMSNNETGQLCNFNFFLLQESQWANGSWTDELSFILDDQAWNDTLNFTWTPEDTRDLGYIFPFNGSNFSWAVQLWDGFNLVEYPSAFGRYFPTPSNPYIGDYWVNYISDWEQGNHLPTMTITHPVCGATYTKAQWRANHALSVTVSDPEGDGIYLALTVKFDGNLSMASSLPLSSNMVNGYDYSGGVPLVNGTYNFDLSWYVPYDNMNYTLTVIAQDTFHPRFEGYGRLMMLPFSIGSPPGADYHLSFKGVNPADSELDKYTSIRDGITGWVSVNRLDPADPGGFLGYGGHAGNRPQVFFFIVDMELHDTALSALPYGGVKYNPIIQKYSFFAGYNPYPWTNFTFYPTMLSNHEYRIYAGVYTRVSTALVGLYGLGDYQTFYGTVEVDMLYDDSMVYQRFSYEYINSYFIDLIYPLPNTYSLYTAQLTGDASFTGAKAGYGTYPSGGGPGLSGSQWGKTYTDALGNIGIGSSGLILTFIIVCGFTFMPYLLVSRGVLDEALHLRRRGKHVPMPILATFALSGFIISYGMGFIELWLFIIPFVLILLVLVFKAVAWITSRKQLLDDTTGGS